MIAVAVCLLFTAVGACIGWQLRDWRADVEETERWNREHPQSAT